MLFFCDGKCRYLVAAPWKIKSFICINFGILTILEFFKLGTGIYFFFYKKGTVVRNHNFLCMRCSENKQTKLLFYRSSFFSQFSENLFETKTENCHSSAQFSTIDNKNIMLNCKVLTINFWKRRKPCCKRQTRNVTHRLEMSHIVN